jgi:quinoprotein dehydrogenase-associated probable ABC transporter substrate-binding protein
MTRPRTWPLAVAAAVAVLALTGSADAKRDLRVCADPDNLPFSNRKLEGFENRIAKLLAREMHATVRYTFKPQRRGFIRRTLKARECDLVMGVPAGYDEVLATKPYYRSTYVFVYASRKDLQIRSFDDRALRQLRIGLHGYTQDGANTPPAHALARRGMGANVVGFTQADEQSSGNPPARIVRAVAAGEIDVGVIWGPFGGYFARREHRPLEVVAVSPSIDPPSLPFAFDISMGVRRGDDALKQELEGVLERKQGEIRKVLLQYGVPLVEEGGRTCEEC